MKRAFAVFYVFVLFISACAQREAMNGTKTTALSGKKFKDSLAFTYEGESGETDSCKSTNGCSYLAVSYPHFRKQTPLNDTIKKIILGNLESYENDGVKESKDFKDTLTNIIDAFPEVDSTADESSPATTYDLDIKVALQAKGLVVLNVYEEYSGGAHPNADMLYINWNTKTNKEISLDDIMVPNYMTALTKVAEKIFRQQNQLSEHASLEEYTFKDGIFALNNNFQVTPAGLDFYYNSYEIASYAQGPTELLIPYYKIRSLLRPNSVVAQYIK